MHPRACARTARAVAAGDGAHSSSIVEPTANDLAVAADLAVFAEAAVLAVTVEAEPPIASIWTSQSFSEAASSERSCRSASCASGRQKGQERF